MVLAVFTVMGMAILSNLNETKSPLSAPTTETAELTSEAELALQEQIAPLIAAGDMAACDQVQNDMYRKVCINNIALNKAEETNDITYCQYLDNELVPREMCEQQVIFSAALETEDIAACAQTTNTELLQECESAAINALALKKDDPTLCNNAVDPTECKDIYYVQQFMKDPKTIECSAFSTPDAQADCAALKPLFETSIPEVAELSKTCQTQRTNTFSFICMQVSSSEVNGVN